MPTPRASSQPRPKSRRTVALLFAAVVMLLAGITVVAPVQAGGIVVVKPSALAGWTIGPEAPPQATGSGGFVTGPGTPPGGSGSVQLTVDATGSHLLGSTLYNAVRLDQITRLQYSTYRVSGGAALAPLLQFNIDYNLSDASTAWQGRLVFDPSLVGSVSTGVWQTWTALSGPASGYWWATGAPGNGLCPQANPCTTAEFLANFPNAGIHATLGAILFKVGPGWSTGFTGNVDGLIIGLSGDDTVFDFEPEIPCTTLCYVNGATGNDSFGGDTPGSAKKTIGAALAQVSPGGTVVVAAGSYAEAVTIVTSGVTLRGAGSTSNPATSTIITGPVGSAAGVLLPNSGTTNVTIRDLRVQGFTNGGICSAGSGNNGLRVQAVAVVANSAGGSCLGGVSVSGPVAGVTITGVIADSNTARGIVVTNGFKQNIAITNNTVTNNNCCGIELLDGTGSGVTITGNTVTGNVDSGITATGLRAGAGPNLIANNILTDNGRVGIELRLPDGSGAESGDGSVVVRDNIVRRVTPIEVQRPSELRDLAGIAVIRRGYVAGAGNVDIPAGVVVTNNTVSGYVQSNPGSASEGFGIVVEGLNMTVGGNTVSSSDVGIQAQAGHLPYTPNSPTDGNQADLADQFFGRGNASVVCAVVSANTFSGNATDTRSLNADDPTVTNQDTGRTFCSLQRAIDDPATLAGHTIVAGPRAYPENVVVDKALTLRGANAGISPNSAPRGAESLISPPSGRGMVIVADGVTVDGFRLSGITGDTAIASGAAFGGDASNVVLRNNLIESSSSAGITVAAPNSGVVTGWTIDDNLLRNLAGPVAAISLQRVDSATLSDNGLSNVSTGVRLDAAREATLTSNSISDVSTGVLIQNGGQATLSDLQLSNSGARAGQGVGLEIAAGGSAMLDGSAAANLIDGFGTGAYIAGALAMADTSISNGVRGVLVEGGADVVTIGTSRFLGQSGDYITLDGYPTDIDGRAAFFGGTRGDSLSLAEYAAVQGKITDAADSPTLGRVVLVVPLSAPVVVTPSNGAAVPVARPVISGTADPGMTVTVRIDAVDVGVVAASATGVWSLTPSADLPDGPHTARARAADAFGNTSAESNSVSFTVDTVAPDSTITTGPPSPTSAPDATISFTGSDGGGTEVASFQCSLDGAPFATCTSPRSYTGLSAGSRTLQVRAVDAAGNVDPTPASYTWIVDTAPLMVTIEQAASQDDPTGVAPVGFSVNFNKPVTDFSAADLALSGTASGALSAALQGSGSSYTVLVSGMTSSGTIIAVIPAGAATDAAGNRSQTSTSLDNTVAFAPATPVVTGIVRAGPSPTNGASVRFTLTFSEPVTGVDASDFRVTAVGVTAAALSGISGSGASWAVTVSTGSGDGALGLNLLDDDSIRSVASGVALGGPGAGNGTFRGQVYTLDRTAPAAALPPVAPVVRDAADLHFTVIYSDGVAVVGGSIATGDIRVSGPNGYSQVATLVSATPTGDGPQIAARYRIIAPGGAWDIAANGVYQIVLEAGQVRDTVGNAAPARSLGSFTVALGAQLYLPLVVMAAPPAAPPDLVVERLAVSEGRLQVTILNQGGTAAADPFWVDAYIGPDRAPTRVNETWQVVGERGLVWGVTSGALPLAPGQRLTLTVDDALFRADLSRLPATASAGTALYIQVDSANTATTYGSLREGHERDGGAYNNITSTTVPAGGLRPLARQAAARSSAESPLRPAR